MIKRSYKKFFSRLSYSFGNEDWRVERKALNIQPQDTVVCITASGDRPLHLLLDPCRELIAVDLNPIQNSLSRLKAIAMYLFNHTEYLSFLGAKEDGERKQKMAMLSKLLTPADREFWGKHLHLIEKGILYQGAIERLCAKIALILKTVRGKRIKELFAFDDIEKQKQFIDETWNRSLWKKAFCFIINSPLFRILTRDPGFFDNVDSSIKPGSYIYDRFHASLQTLLAKNNPFISLIFRGYVEECAFPPYLTKEGTDLIKPRLRLLRWETANMIDFLEKSEPNSFDCFSLSDIASYMDAQSFRRLIHAVFRSAKPAARFSIRQFMSEQVIPSEMSAYFQRNLTLEKELEKEDCCCIYRLMVGTINK